MLLFSVICCVVAADAQTIRTPGSFAYTRLAAYSNQFTNAFSFSGNTAALASTKRFSAGVFSERRFNLEGLAGHTAAIALPTASGNFGIRGDYFGGAAYRESAAALAYARNLGEKVAVGLQFNYFNLAAAGYGSASAINFDAGVMIRLTPQLNAGIQACNPVAATMGSEGTERMPSVYRMGLGYDVSKQVLLSAEAEKVEDQPVGINAGLQYQVADKITAIAGIRSATSAYYLGFGISLKNVRFDVAVSLHPYLGPTPGLLLLYSAPQ
jgi:hypothetical protein